MKEKVILAYSGGLDTTAIIPWLKEHFDYEVICCCIDCGQGEELDGLEERAKLSGASKLYIEDIVDDFCDHYIVPCVQAGAVYENKYLLGTAMARPGIAKKLVEIARKEGASAICHGATGKGNDQIRFELGIKALAPDLKIIAPWRMTDVWTMQSRQEEIDYCKAHGIDLPFSADSSYSRDRNLWHISHEGLELEDPAAEPNYDHLLVLGVTAVQSKALRKFFKKECVNEKTGEILDSSKIRSFVDFDKVAEYRKSLGYYQIITSELTMDAQEVIEKYHGLTQIEDQFRVMKGDLDTRPLYVRTPEHVTAHLLVCMISLILLRIIQKRLKDSGVVQPDPDAYWSGGMSAARIQTALNKWKVDTLPSDLYRFMDVDDPDLKRILDAFGIRIPVKLYRRAELKHIKTEIKVFM